MLSSDEMVTDIASEMPDLPLGVRAHAVYQTRSRLLGAGDRLVLYTDGVTEAENTQSEFFGVERLSAVVRAERNAEANILIQSLRDAIFEFADGAEQFDDITMLVIGWKPMG